MDITSVASFLEQDCILSKTPRIPDRIDELVEHWDREQAKRLGKPVDSDE